MKVSNETKVGALAAISITLLILGFNLLKGKSLFNHNKTIYAMYANVDGLAQANAVQVNGLTVGNVSGLEVMDKNVGQILVKISIKKDINIPKNSVASIINEDLLGTKAVRIDFGDATEYLQNGDTIHSSLEGSLVDKLVSSLQPATVKLQSTLVELDSVLADLHIALGPTTRNNLQQAIVGFNTSMQQLSKTSVKADRLVSNLDSISGNLADNSDNINQILGNMRKTSASLAGAGLDTTLAHMGEAVASLNQILAKVNQSDGSLGLLVNDKKLYETLQATTVTLDRLLEDLRLNPKRYVHFSLFGKKQTPASVPADSLSTQ